MKKSKKVNKLIVGFIWVVLLFIVSCDNKSGIEGNNNKNNRIVIGDNNIVNEVPQKMDYIPSDFFEQIGPGSSLVRVYELFGTPFKTKKTGNTTEINGSIIKCEYFYLLFNLQNANMLIISKDNTSVGSICIDVTDSNTLNPEINVSNICPDLPSELVLGKSKFLDIFDKTEKNKMSILKKNQNYLVFNSDRCSYHFVYEDYGARPCGYNTVFYGTNINWSDVTWEEESKDSQKISLSDGHDVYVNTNPSEFILNYVIFGDDQLIKCAHSYLESIHCDLWR